MSKTYTDVKKAKKRADFLANREGEAYIVDENTQAWQKWYHVYSLSTGEILFGHTLNIIYTATPDDDSNETYKPRRTYEGYVIELDTVEIDATILFVAHIPALDETTTPTDAPREAYEWAMQRVDDFIEYGPSQDPDENPYKEYDPTEDPDWDSLLRNR